MRKVLIYCKVLPARIFNHSSSLSNSQRTNMTGDWTCLLAVQLIAPYIADLSIITLVYQRVPAPLCQEALETPSASATARAPLVGTSRNSSAVPVPIRRPELSHNPGVIRHAGRAKREDKNNKNKYKCSLAKSIPGKFMDKTNNSPKKQTSNSIISYPMWIQFSRVCVCGCSYRRQLSTKICLPPRSI
jgi:hypothetical protein